ncbi:unnamed protein product [Amoebophrya sp. A120]|nr:unnamed protein product [Amoebophrya sp. A120]|eukprot:GSA120T00001967001.1
MQRCAMSPSTRALFVAPCSLLVSVYFRTVLLSSSELVVELLREKDQNAAASSSSRLFYYAHAARAEFSYDPNAPLSPDEISCTSRLGSFVLGSTSTEDNLMDEEYRACRQHLLTAHWRTNHFPGSGYEYQSGDCAFWGQIALPDRHFHNTLSFDLLSRFRLDRALRKLPPSGAPSPLDQDDKNAANAPSQTKLLSVSAEPPFYGLPEAVRTMVYIGAFKNGTDGVHFARLDPDLEVHFFEPSMGFFQHLVHHVLGLAERPEQDTTSTSCGSAEEALAGGTTSSPKCSPRTADETVEIMDSTSTNSEDVVPPLKNPKRLFFHNYGVGPTTELLRLAVSGDGSSVVGEEKRTGEEEENQNSDRTNSPPGSPAGTEQDENSATAARRKAARAEAASRTASTTESIVVRSVTETFQTIERVTDTPLKQMFLLHLNCEGCEYDVLPSLNFATLAALPHIQFATHIVSSVQGDASESPAVVPVARRISRSMAGYCRVHERLELTHRRVMGLPFVWERWERRCHWHNLDVAHPPTTNGGRILKIPVPVVTGRSSQKDNIVVLDKTDEFDQNLRDENPGSEPFARGVLVMSYVYEAFVATCGMTVCAMKTANEQEGDETSEDHVVGFAFREALEEGDSRRCYAIIASSASSSPSSATPTESTSSTHGLLDYTHTFLYSEAEVEVASSLTNAMKISAP